MHNVDAKAVALKHFAAGYNCAEAVLLAVTQALDLDPDDLPRVATGFGGGIGCWGEVCGSLTGAVMALGLKFGRSDPADVHAKERVYGLASLLMRDFEDNFGNVRCLSLTGCDMHSPEGRMKARELDLSHTLCPDFVGFVAQRTVELIREAENRE